MYPFPSKLLQIIVGPSCALIPSLLDPRSNAKILYDQCDKRIFSKGMGEVEREREMPQADGIGSLYIESHTLHPDKTENYNYI